MQFDATQASNQASRPYGSAIDRSPVRADDQGKMQSTNNAANSRFATIGASFMRKLNPQQKKNFEDISRPTQQSVAEGNKFKTVSERLLNLVKKSKDKATLMREGWGKLTPDQRQERLGFLADSMKKDMNKEGIFRLSPDEKSYLKQVPSFFSRKWQGVDNLDINMKANLFKNCLKEASIFESQKSEILGFEKQEDKEKAAKEICDKLEPEQKQILGLLMKTMHETLSKSHDNKMGETALSVVISPNLFKPDPKETNPMTMMKEAKASNDFFQFLLENRVKLNLVPPWEKASPAEGEQKQTIGSHRPNQ